MECFMEIMLNNCYAMWLIARMCPVKCHHAIQMMYELWIVSRIFWLEDENLPIHHVYSWFLSKFVVHNQFSVWMPGVHV